MNVQLRIRPSNENVIPKVTYDINECFSPAASQEEIYQSYYSTVQSFVQGKCPLVFVYGQTGSGKTHTILGPPGCLTEAELAKISPSGFPPSWGLFPCVALDAFRIIQGKSATLKISAIEIYLDRLYDLLNGRQSISFGGGNVTKASSSRYEFYLSKPAPGEKWVNPFEKKKLEAQLHQHSKSVKSKKVLIQQESDIASLLRLVEVTRTCQSHSLNERSSRSHCLLGLHLQWIEGQTLYESTFTCVDLAGSERIYKSGVANDFSGGAHRFNLRGHASIDLPSSRLDEAKNVNTSLSSLSRVLACMAASEKHVPFRDSTLTSVLQSQFETGTDITLILHTRSEANNMNETDSTLRFGKVVAEIPQRRKLKARSSVMKQSVANRIEEIDGEMDDCAKSMASMAKASLAGGFDASVPAPTIAQFKENKRCLDESKDSETKLKEKLAELKAVNSEDNLLKDLQEEIKVVQHKVWVYTGLVARQLTTAIWQPPHPAYEARERLVAELEKEKAILLQFVSSSEQKSCHV